MMNFTLKTRNCVFKMMNFAGDAWVLPGGLSGPVEHPCGPSTTDGGEAQRGDPVSRLHTPGHPSSFQAPKKNGHSFFYESVGN